MVSQSSGFLFIQLYGVILGHPVFYLFGPPDSSNGPARLTGWLFNTSIQASQFWHLIYSGDPKSGRVRMVEKGWFRSQPFENRTFG